MSDRQKQVADELQTALVRLYDYAYLETHPLVTRLPSPPQRGSAGRALSQYLIAAVEALKPRADLAQGSRPWRNYRYLLSRYVNMRSVAEVSRELGISERQSQRTNGEAVEALAASLWPRTAEPEQGADSVHGLPFADTPSQVDEASPASAEIARLAETPGRQTASLADALEGVTDMMAKMLAGHHATLTVQPLPDTATLPMERTLLRQGLLSLLLACLNRGARSIAVGGTASAQGFTLRVQVSGPERSTAGAVRFARALREDRSLRMAARLLGAGGNAFTVEEGTAGEAVIQARFITAGSRRVLLVDDNPDTLRLFRRYLSNSSYTVLEATSGGQAIALARHWDPDVIVLDVMMPGQDGWETLQMLRNDPDRGDVPVIICSVIDEPELAQSLGASALLPKPVNRQELLHALEHCLG
ncbi:MAG: response regulator [Chloroflexota bacterium]